MEVAAYLRNQFKDYKPIEIDFDLGVAYFLQETDHLHIGKIPESVYVILADLKLVSPQTPSQAALEECANDILDIIDAHLHDPLSPIPFALRYPDLDSLHALARQRTENLILLPENEPALFVDVFGRVLAVAVPPKRSTHSHFISGEVRGLFLSQIV